MTNKRRRILPIFLSLILCLSCFTGVSSTFAADKPDTTLPSGCVWRGDLNEDNFIDVTDIVLLRANIIGKTDLSSRQLLIGDIDGSGAIDVIDVVMVRSDILKTASLGISVGYSSYGYVKFGTVTSDTDSPTSSSSSSTTKQTITQKTEDITLEAEDASLSGNYSIVSSATVSGNEYVKVGSNITMQFTVPSNVLKGNYIVTVVAKSESGTPTNYVLDANGTMNSLKTSSAWNSYEYKMDLSAGDVIFISTGDGNFSVDYITIIGAKVSVPTPVTSKKSTTTTTKTTTKSTTSTTKSTTKTTTTTTKKASSSGGFYISGTKLYDANGKEFIMRGINSPYAWFPGNNGTSLKGMSSMGANCVRIVLGEGTRYTKTTESQVSSIISMCEKYKLVCVLEIHDFTGKDDQTMITSKAVNYWLAMKNLLNQHKDTVIVNIANEWMSGYSQTNWVSAYTSAVKSLRSGGIQNVLMIDAPGWGQGGSAVAGGAKSILAADSTGNTMFSIHMYSVAGGTDSKVKSNIDNTLNQNICLVIGEFGHYQSGSVAWQTIMSYCQQKGVGWMAWSWKGNSGADTVLDIATYWSGSSLTDWGNNVFYSTYGIKNTSKLCSVFG